MPIRRVQAFTLALLVMGSCVVFGEQTAGDSAAMRQFEAHAVEVEGQVSRTRGEQPWAVVQGERVPVSEIITTGRDGFARFSVIGGSEFSLSGNSRVTFRGNTATAGDLLDVVAGRVRVKLRPAPGQMSLRVFTPVAVISTSHPALISIAIDEDQKVRLDVLEGEVRVQHRLLPRNESTLVRAVDAILIDANQQLSRQLDRGTLYRYTVKPLHDLWTAFAPTWAKAGEPIEGNKLLAEGIKR